MAAIVSFLVLLRHFAQFCVILRNFVELLNLNLPRVIFWNILKHIYNPGESQGKTTKVQVLHINYISATKSGIEISNNISGMKISTEV